MKKQVKNTIWGFYTLTIGLCFLFFSHTDALITNIQSYFYFDHIYNFYDFSKNQIATAAYLPSIYIILAVWNLPLTMLDLVNQKDLLTWCINYPDFKISAKEYGLSLGWYKLGLLLVSVSIFIYLKKIRQLIGRNNYKIELLYITSPFVIFSSMIFSGYDVFSVIFTLIGFYYFLKKNILKFSIFFSIAITFKFFALIIFFPLILLYEKRFLFLIKYSIIAISLSVISVLLSLNNESFFNSIFFVAQEKLSYGKFNPLLILFLIMYALICLYAYTYNEKKKKAFYKTAVYITYLSYLSLFLTTKFHPQWILLIMPFIFMTYSFEKNQGNQIALIESIGFTSFIFLIVNIWKNNIDQKMISQGPLSQLLPNPQFMMANFFNFHPIKPILLIIFFLYLMHPLYLRKISFPKKENILFAYSRFIMVFIFIIFSIYSVFPPKKYQSIDLESQYIYKKSLKCLYSNCS